MDRGSLFVKSNKFTYLFSHETLKSSQDLECIKVQALAELPGVHWGGGGTRARPPPECPAQLASRLCRSNWNLEMLVFDEKQKL